MILTNARIVTFDSADRVIDAGSVEIRADGTIGFVKRGRVPGIDAGGRLLMPALINCHTHLYSTLARGMLLPGPPPANFQEILKKLWWRLDRALTADDIYYSALVGLIDSAKCGVGTVIDHHSSPGACPDSLDHIERAFHQVGLRGATCYETSDRDGALPSLIENTRFISSRRPGALVGAAFGLHASFTLSEPTLRACAELNQSLGAAFHVHVAEDRSDRSAVTRLERFGILDERTLAAHCIHLSRSESRILAARGVNVIHNPQSNCNNAVGTAVVPKGVLVGLGSDGYSPRMWDELKTSLHLQKLGAHDPRAAYAGALLNNRAIVKKIWGWELGRIETGAQADLVLADYFPPTPLHAGNLSGHLLFGISNAPVDSLIVNGRFVVRDRQCVNLDERRIAAKAAARAKALWERL
jgi:putative selenium metabolism protein SsnA